LHHFSLIIKTLWTASKPPAAKPDNLPDSAMSPIKSYPKSASSPLRVKAVRLLRAILRPRLCTLRTQSRARFA